MGLAGRAMAAMHSHQSLSLAARPCGICGEERGTGMWRQLLTGAMTAHCLLMREEVNIYIYTHTHIHIHTYIHTYIHICT